MLQDTRIALFLLEQLIAAPQANDPDTFKRWIVGGIQDLRKPTVTELMADWMTPLLTQEEADRLVSCQKIPHLGEVRGSKIENNIVALATEMHHLNLKVTTISILGFALISSLPVKAQPGPHHDACIKAVDYLGCVKALSGETTSEQTPTSTIKIDQTNRPGLLAEIGNDCPSGMAYAGAGKCRNIICTYRGIFGRHNKQLAGKGHKCPSMGIGYGGSMDWGGEYTNATNNPACPPGPPKIGHRSTCNTLSTVNNDSTTTSDDWGND